VQRVVFARELARRPRLLLAYYPSRGIDVAGVQAVHAVLRAAQAEGAAVLLVSEDLDELVEMSDRLAVMYHGEIVATMPAAEADLTWVGLLMTGAAQAARAPAARSPESAEEPIDASDPAALGAPV